jgi:23S rRNA (adenine2503-C2)-methyltransferase
VTQATKPDLRSLLPDELAQLLSSLGEPPYRALQLFRWVHRRAARSFDEMTNLPASLRSRLAQLAALAPLELASQLRAPDGTTKAALRLHDGHLIESVLIPHPRRTTVCVSTQVGCAFGCRLCASGARGLARSLTPGEILGQVYHFARELDKLHRRISNVVFMGSGEPLANYEAVLRALKLLNHPQGLAIGARHLSISTCGLPGGIRRLAREPLQVGLAVSLHAPDDQTRSRLMPVNRKYPLALLIAACRDYARRTGRKITFEYALVAGLNDQPPQARALAALLRGLPCVVNLIPANPTTARQSVWRAAPPTRAGLAAFRRELEAHHLEVALRRPRGREIIGACGQLTGAPSPGTS